MAVYVVDTGFLREQRLAEFLSVSESNSVAIAEYTCIESYQGDTFSNIERSTRILRRFPSQVVVLRGATRRFRKS